MSNNFQKSFLFALKLLLVALLLFAPSAQAEINSTNPSRDALLFRNGDLLIGNLKSIAGDLTVTWERNDVFQPIEFSVANLSAIQFTSGQKAIVSATNGCRIQLRNGDSLEGKLIHLDSEKVILETLFAGKMVFPRPVIEVLEPLPPEQKPIFVGPTSLDGWTIGKVTAVGIGEAGQWKYTNGAFYATRAASVARDLKLPDVAHIEFDLAWKGMLQAAIALYTSYMQPVNLQTKDTDPDFGAFYSLQINSFVSTLMPVRKNSPLKYMGQVPVAAFNQKNHAHVEIFANKSKRSIALVVDGSLVKEWVDTEDFAGSGTGMRFVHQGQGAIKLSNLRIADWNGKMESKSTNLPPFTENLAMLLNGDKVFGRLESFRDGKLSFSTEKGKLDIPFERISETFFARKPGETITKERTNVRAFFNDDDYVTFRIERWDDQGVVAVSPNFGRVTFAPSTFRRIQFNPDLEPAPAQTPPVKIQIQ